MTSAQQQISKIESNFALHPIKPSPSEVYIGMSICKNGEIFDIVTERTFEKCLQGVLHLAKIADRETLNVEALKLKLLQQAAYNGRYGTKGGLICQVSLGSEEFGNLETSHSICYKEIKDDKVVF